MRNVYVVVHMLLCDCRVALLRCTLLLITATQTLVVCSLRKALMLTSKLV